MNVVGGARGGRGGGDVWNLQPLELQESDHQNQPVSTLCFLGLGSIGGAPALPLPPSLFFFFGGVGERGRPCFVCGWGRGGGGGKNFWLLSDAGPLRLAQWGCMLITYLIREEFKVCVLGRGRGGREPPLETSSPRPVMVRCLQGFFVVAVVFNYFQVLNRPQSRQ